MLLDYVGGYPISALARAFPPHTFEELHTLVEDICGNGQRRPIVRDPETGEIYDGVGRLKACEILGISPQITDFDGSGDPWDLVLSENAIGRHLDQNDKAIIGYFLSTGFPTASLGANLHPRMTKVEAGNRIGVSVRLIKYAGKALSTDNQQLREALLRRRIKVSDAAKVVDKPPEVLQRALEMVLDRRPTSGRKRASLKAAVTRVEKQLSLEEGVSKRNTILAQPASDTIRLLNCELGSLRKHVDKESVDVIVTFPPAEDGSISYFYELIRFAAHALAQDGLMAVMANPQFLHRIIDSLQLKGVFYLLELDYRCPDRPLRLEHPLQGRIGRLSILVFGKEKTRISVSDDFIEEPSKGDAAGLKPHELLDAGLQKVVQRFAKPGQVVCDPITLGRVGTALGARNAGCTFAGCTFIGAADRQNLVEQFWANIAQAERDQPM